MKHPARRISKSHGKQGVALTYVIYRCHGTLSIGRRVAEGLEEVLTDDHVAENAWVAVSREF